MSKKRNPKKLLAFEIEEGLKNAHESPKEIFRNILGDRPWVKYKNEKQKEYTQIIEDNEISICTGPAGTGKSTLAIIKALDMMWHTDNEFECLVLVKPVVEAGESLGFLPGEKEDKLYPYVYSSLYVIEKFFGTKVCERLIDEGFVKFQALAYMRGINYDKSIIFLEEAQNTTIPQMKTILTRIGSNSKMIISGDLEQSDRYHEEEVQKSGLYEAMCLLQDIDGIGMFEFDGSDVVRNPLITKILKRFNEYKAYK
jgi:phosphate starvation-inducible PhoH-like protein